MKNVQAAIRSLRERWQRSLLSATGVLVATVAIVLLVSIAKGVRDDVTSQVEELGVNVLIVLPGRIELGGMSFNPNLGGQSYLRPEHAQALDPIPGVRRTALLSFAGGGVRRGEEEAYPLVIAAEADWFEMHPTDLESGRTYTDQDGPVAVIGGVAREQLFPGGEDPIGQKVSINEREYTVVGCTKDEEQEQSLFSMGSFQNVVYIPLADQIESNPQTQIHRIMVQSEPDAEPKALVAGLEAKMGEFLDYQQYSVLTQEDLLGLVYDLMGILTWLLTGLTSIALFVAGVGIMTVMLMSVSERAKEIGVLKTLGARRSDIFQQFLTESVLLALVGGSVGFAFSYAVCIALRTYTSIKPLVSWDVVALAFGVSIGVGALFGILPAMNAARKDPVAALRSE